MLVDGRSEWAIQYVGNEEEEDSGELEHHIPVAVLKARV